MKGGILMSYEILSLDQGGATPLSDVGCVNFICDIIDVVCVPDLICGCNEMCGCPTPQNPRCDAIGGGCATSIGGDRPNR